MRGGSTSTSIIESISWSCFVAADIDRFRAPSFLHVQPCTDSTWGAYDWILVENPNRKGEFLWATAGGGGVAHVVFCVKSMINAKITEQPLA
jgi:hypothetical protein